MRHFLLISILGATFAMVWGHGCSDVKLRKADFMQYTPSGVDANYCTTASDEIKSNLKFIFVVDRSGSNQQRYDLANNNMPLPGTDPRGDRRFSPLERFIQGFQSDPFVYWSMISFASTVLNNGSTNGFSNNKANFATFVTDQHARTNQIDAGETNYQAALDGITRLIQNDIEAGRNANPKISSNYVIFFVSDGEPIVNGNLQIASALYAKIDALLTFEKTEKLLVEGIQFNSGYYFEPPVSTTARDILSNMATHGNGDFLEFGAGQEIDFSRFAIPTRVAKFDLKELWVVNSNTTWVGDALKADSDADGIADDVEFTLGSNAFAADSDSNGVSDGVEYFLSGKTKPCKSATCELAGADPFTTCRGLELPAGSAKRYGDIDRDFLNDCEEKLLGSDKEDPDTNHDYVPDDLAFKAEINMIEPSDAGYLDPDYDNLSNYQELKYNSPMRTANSLVPGLILTKYYVSLVSSNAKQDCYHIDVRDIVTRKQSDKIRAYFMENTKALNERRLMRVVEKSLVGGYLNLSNSEIK